MQTSAVLLSLSFSVLAQAQPPAQPPKPTPRAEQPPPARPAAPTRATMSVMVTDRQGNTLPDVEVGVTGPAERDGTTDSSGTISFRNLGAGTYRLRFEHPEFVTLEREVSMQAGRALRTSAALTPAPSPPPEPEPAAAPPAPTPRLPPPGSQSPTWTSIPDVFERNYIGKNPSRTLAVGCVGVATAQLIQLRDPLDEHTHDDADESLYVVAGEGVVRAAAGGDILLAAGTLAMLPRGTAHTIARQGSRPLVLLSILSGPPCTAGRAGE
jgi:quercetin dioxygenase-like cupin family protein